MSQHDFQVDSGDGFKVRADINAAIQALASNNAGLTEPPTKYAGMWWPDTTAGIMKQRNADNSAWIDRFPLNGTVTPRVKFVASGTVNAITGVTNIGLTSYPTGWQFTAWVSGANTLIAPTLSFDGLSAKTIKKQGAAGKVPLAIGDYNQFGPLILEYDGTDFLLLNPLNGAFFGYAAGLGGTVTQATSKTTAVTLNKLCGLITTHNATLAAGAYVSFAVNNSMFQMGDVVVLMLQNGTQGDVMLVHVWAAVPGVFYLNLKNNSGAPQALAVDIYFAIIKGATS